MLRVVLETLNREIETANRRDDAIWFPMGCCHERILRLTAKEAVLLNSREKVGTVLSHCSGSHSIWPWQSVCTGHCSIAR